MQIGRLVLALVALVLAGGAFALFASRGTDDPRPTSTPAEAPNPGAQGPTQTAVIPRGTQPQDPVRRPIRDEFGELLPRLHGDGGIGGILRAEDGSGVSGGLVWLIHPTDDEEVLDTRTTDERGRFLFPVGLEGEGFASFRLAAHDPARGISEATTVAVPSRGEVTLVELRAAYAFGSIVGRVLGPGGRPVPDHPVLLVRIDPAADGPQWRAGRDDSEVRTGPDGAFVARGLRPGKFEVDADPREEPAGELGARGSERPEVVTDGPAVSIELPWVRVDVVATTAEGREQTVDGFTLHVYAEPMAQLAAARFAAGQVLAPPDVVATADRDLRVSGTRGSFWVVPGCFVIAETDAGPRRAQAGDWVARDVAVAEIRVGRSDQPSGTLSIRCRSSDGAPIADAIVRLSTTGGVPFVPEGVTDLGAGFMSVDPDHPFVLPPSNYRAQVIAGPVWTTSRPLPGEFLQLESSVAVAPSAMATLELEFQRAARIEFEILCDASSLRGAEPDRFAGRVGDLPIARLNGSVEFESQFVPLLFGVPSPTDPSRFLEVAGVPWQSNLTTHARALTVVQPGPGELSVSSWRSASEDAAGAHWSVELVPGVNRFRLRLDAELVVHFLGR